MEIKIKHLPRSQLPEYVYPGGVRPKIPVKKKRVVRRSVGASGSTAASPNGGATGEKRGLEEGAAVVSENSENSQDAKRAKVEGEVGGDVTVTQSDTTMTDATSTSENVTENSTTPTPNVNSEPVVPFDSQLDELDTISVTPVSRPVRTTPTNVKKPMISLLSQK